MDTVLASCTDAAALATAIAHRCPQARQHGEQWQACCPAHDDHTPSLSITPAADKVLLYCHAQCPLDAILAALGLTRRDLFVHSAAPRNGHRRIVETYNYVDAHGVLVHQTVRLTQDGLLACWQRRHAPHIQNFPRYYAAMLRGLITQHCKRLRREQQWLRPWEEADPCSA
jgi:hypothetical protein